MSRTTPSSVIAGLDPAIHLSAHCASGVVSRGAMDARVKPGHDGLLNFRVRDFLRSRA